MIACSVRDVVEARLVGDLALRDVHVSLHIVELWRAPSAVAAHTSLNITQAFGELSELRVDLLILRLRLLSVLIKLSSDVELQVHLERLRVPTPLLLAQSLRNIVGELLLPNQDRALNIVWLDIAEAE